MRTRRRDLDRGLESLNRGCWCVVTDMTRRVLSWMEIGSCPSWQVRFAEMIEAAARAGWQLEQVEPSFNNFFCHRDGMRVLVSLQSTAPRNPLEEWALPQQAASLRECLQLRARARC